MTQSDPTRRGWCCWGLTRGVIAGESPGRQCHRIQRHPRRHALDITLYRDDLDDQAAAEVDVDPGR